MNISGILNDLNDAAKKLSDISSDVANMVIIDNSNNATRDMNDKLHQIKSELLSVADVIEENKKIIQNCCDALGINVSFYSGGGGSNAFTMNHNMSSTVSYSNLN